MTPTAGLFRHLAARMAASARLLVAFTLRGFVKLAFDDLTTTSEQKGWAASDKIGVHQDSEKGRPGARQARSEPLYDKALEPRARNACAFRPRPGPGPTRRGPGWGSRASGDIIAAWPRRDAEDRPAIGCQLTDIASLLAVATAVPPHLVVQKEVAALAHAVFAGRYPAFERMAQVFETSGIRTRYAVRPPLWYLEDHGWPERTAAYLEGADALFVEVAQEALRAASVGADEIDTIVTVSSTGIATPSLEARSLSRMGFRPDVARVPIFGLGCAGGVSGFSIAARLAEARPGTNVLLVVIELCTLASRPDSLSKANIVATALFGDGAAACVLRAGDGGLADVESAGEYTWPDTLDLMGWDVDPEGFGVIFARSIPAFVEANLGVAVASLLDKSGLGLADIDRFICHPGGAKVVMALERALSLEQGSLDHEREVLETYGNMSAPTVFFVLERVLRAGLPRRSVLSALGPGFTASLVSLKRAA